jgi:hypothetical protein
MHAEWRRLIAILHDQPLQCVVVVTGGGASAIGDLLTVPGGSRTILEAIVPYSSAALNDWLRRPPEQYCSPETARAMAAVAWERARALAAAAGDPPFPAETRYLGIACTASLVSDRPKKGPHRLHLAVEADDATRSIELNLEKGARDREGEEQLAGQALLTALARSAGLSEIPILALREAERLEEVLVVADPLLVALRRGTIRLVWSLPGGDCAAEWRGTGGPRGVLCGAFNPLHFGHEQLRAAAEVHLGGPVCFEISLRNVDKPPLDYISIDERRRQFTDVPLALTSAPTFAEKSAVLPGCTFVVGVDTAERIIQPRYYGHEEEAMRQALATIARNQCRFLVAGRAAGAQFMTLASLAIPPEFAALFEELPASAFRADVSSTELRKSRPAPP